jgi:predicted alpha/beta hydrolase
MRQIAGDHVDGIRTEISCADGVKLGGHWWKVQGQHLLGTVIINPATGVLARYYHRYAAFLATHGFDVLTYDYRGIGLSRPKSLRGGRCSWRDWGERDFDAALLHALAWEPASPILVVGHSIGGFLPGYAENAFRIHRMLTVGAQRAYWPDYLGKRRLRMVMKWHVLMPAITAAFGYFPGRLLGWLEDLPADIVWSWSFAGREFEARLPEGERRKILRRFAEVGAQILAIGISDDHFGTKAALSRALEDYVTAEPTKVMLEPRDLGFDAVGHFDLFHSRHASSFWLDTLLWLRDGINPWPHRRFD